MWKYRHDVNRSVVESPGNLRFRIDLSQIGSDRIRKDPPLLCPSTDKASCDASNGVAITGDLLDLVTIEVFDQGQTL